MLTLSHLSPKNFSTPTQYIKLGWAGFIGKNCTYLATT